MQKKKEGGSLYYSLKMFYMTDLSKLLYFCVQFNQLSSSAAAQHCFAVL